MSGQLDERQISCPYCGENLEILVDSSSGTHAYIEDCQVCCSPIEITLEIDTSGRLLAIHGKRDSD